MNTGRKAIFIDKDGTLIVDVPYNIDPEKIRLTDNCITGLLKLQQRGYLLLIVSNQSGVARGYFEEGELAKVEQRIMEMLIKETILLNGFYYCPHHPEGTSKEYAIECDCRKPQPGMLIKAAEELGIDLNSSWMIGDILNDVEAGKRAGCRSILIDNGNETEWLLNNWRVPAARVKNIDQAADFILNQDDKLLAKL
jgi:D-glycero-D-manno-heptose 1,7-bisphosphate phosphatase